MARQPGYNGTSQISEAELNEILAMIPADEKTWMLEIGAYCGVSAAWLCDRRPGLRVLSLDIFMFDTMADYKKNKRPGMSLFWGDTAQMLDHVPRKNYHVIFVDGGHDYEPCLQDLRNCGEMLFHGGRLICHDYCPDYPGVIRAVDEYAAEKNKAVIRLAGSIVEIK